MSKLTFIDYLYIFLYILKLVLILSSIYKKTKAMNTGYPRSYRHI